MLDRLCNDSKYGYKNEMRELVKEIKKSKESKISRVNSDLKLNKSGRDISVILDKELGKYFSEIENATSRKIQFKQRRKIKHYIRTHNIVKLTKEKVDELRKPLREPIIKADIIREWEKNTNQKWPVYMEPVIINGEEVRNIGFNYDMHHIIESSYGGENVWWNIHPAKFPSEHQQGIHAKSSVADKLFGRY